MDQSYPIQVESTGIKRRWPWIVDFMALRIKADICILQTSNHINHPDMSNMADVKAGTVAKLVQVERGTIAESIFTCKIVDLPGVDSVKSTHLLQGLG